LTEGSPSATIGVWQSVVLLAALAVIVEEVAVFGALIVR
jgi:hypothetical protein